LPAMTPDNAKMSAAFTDSVLPLQRLCCARCGTSFECGASAGACWCMNESYRLPMPNASDAACLCPACLGAAAAASAGLSA
jgi:Cysteine-rich CWC